MVAAVTALAGLLVAVAGLSPGWLGGWLAGLCAGAVTAGVTAPRRRDRRRGATERRRRTTDALGPLQAAGWRFVHDVSAPCGAFDHIAVGPGGVILMETTGLAGSAVHPGAAVMPLSVTSEDGSRLAVIRHRVLADAAIIREEIEKLAGRRLWVQAVVVLWSDFPAGCVVDGRCVFIHGSRLARWLERRPPQLEPEQVDALFAAAQLMAQREGVRALAAAA